MTNLLKTAAFCLLTALCAYSTSCTQAQNPNPAAEEAALVKGFDEVWAAYEAGDEAKMWAAYADAACEIYPDGSLECGKKAIQAGFEAFKGMLEGKPSWTYTRPTVRFIEPNVALLISDVTSDIKLKGGQQIGGKMKFVALMHRVGGKWFIEFDGQTPVLPPPPGMETGKN